MFRYSFLLIIGVEDDRRADYPCVGHLLRDAGDRSRVWGKGENFVTIFVKIEYRIKTLNIARILHQTWHLLIYL